MPSLRHVAGDSRELVIPLFPADPDPVKIRYRPGLFTSVEEDRFRAELAKEDQSSAIALADFCTRLTESWNLTGDDEQNVEPSIEAYRNLPLSVLRKISDIMGADMAKDLDPQAQTASS